MFYHWGILASNDQQSNRLVPRSHILQEHFSLSQAATKIMSFRENYQQLVTLESVAQSWRIPNRLNATGLAISKQSTSLHHCEHQKGTRLKSDRLVKTSFTTAQPCPSQASTPCQTGPSITRSKTSQPSHHDGGILD